MAVVGDPAGRVDAGLCGRSETGGLGKRLHLGNELGDWEISLTDNTNGQSFSVKEPYDGPLASAEWVTEAYSSSDCANADLGSESAGVYNGPLAAYSPAAQFSDMRISGTNTSIEPVSMFQNGQLLSTPSSYSSGAFNTSYTGSTNSAAQPALSPPAGRLTELPAPHVAIDQRMAPGVEGSRSDELYCCRPFADRLLGLVSTAGNGRRGFCVRHCHCP